MTREYPGTFDETVNSPSPRPGKARARPSKPTATGNGRHILPMTDFADFSTLSRKVWVVHHLLAVGEASTWYGEPGSGKSVLVEDLGLHVAAGRPWHGRPVAQGAVLFVALERASVVARRAIAFGMKHELAALPFAMVRGPLDFRDADDRRIRSSPLLTTWPPATTSSRC